METFVLAFPKHIAPELLDSFLKARGAYSTSHQGGQYRLSRDAAAVYISVEDEASTDADSLDRLHKKAQWSPRSVILLTVSRREGSLLLAFEVAESLATQWNGFIDWAGLDQWENWFVEWKQANKARDEV